MRVARRDLHEPEVDCGVIRTILARSVDAGRDHPVMFEKSNILILHWFPPGGHASPDRSAEQRSTGSPACVRLSTLGHPPFPVHLLEPELPGCHNGPVSPWHFILAVLAGWVHREQLKVLKYLQAENCALREKLGNKRLRFTDEQRRRLAM
jgi:hypothetical protein